MYKKMLLCVKFVAVLESVFNNLNFIFLSSQKSGVRSQNE